MYYSLFEINFEIFFLYLQIGALCCGLVMLGIMSAVPIAMIVLGKYSEVEALLSSKTIQLSMHLFYTSLI